MTDRKMNGISVAASGIQAGLIRQMNVAHNIANLNTEGARRLRTEQTDTPAGWSRAGTFATGEDIDLAAELVELRLAKLQTEASVHAFRISAEVEESILDILA